MKFQCNDPFCHEEKQPAMYSFSSGKHFWCWASSYIGAPLHDAFLVGLPSVESIPTSWKMWETCRKCWDTKDTHQGTRTCRNATLKNKDRCNFLKTGTSIKHSMTHPAKIRKSQKSMFEIVTQHENMAIYVAYIARLCHFLLISIHFYITFHANNTIFFMEALFSDQISFADQPRVITAFFNLRCPDQ